MSRLCPFGTRLGLWLSTVFRRGLEHGKDAPRGRSIPENGWLGPSLQNCPPGSRYFSQPDLNDQNKIHHIIEIRV